MSVWCNRWYNEGFTALVLITGWEFFCIKIQKGTGHVSIRDVVKLKNTTSPNKKEEEEMYQKVSTDLKFVDREKKTEKFPRSTNVSGTRAGIISSLQPRGVLMAMANSDL